MATIQDLESLTSALSPQATVDIKGSAAYAASAARWSDLNTPKPGAVINVASEADVEATVRWATGRGVPFVAQSGGHGWSSWYRVGGDGIVINMRALNSVVVDVENGTAVLGGGVTVKEAATAAKAAKAHLSEHILPIKPGSNRRDPRTGGVVRMEDVLTGEQPSGLATRSAQSRPCLAEAPAT